MPKNCKWMKNLVASHSVTDQYSNDNYGDEREKFNPHTTKVARVLEHDRRKTESDAK